MTTYNQAITYNALLTYQGIDLPVGNQPLALITLDGVDITDDVHAPLGSPTVRWGRGANFDGTGEAPGYCVVSVLNNDKRYSPYNASSPLAPHLKFGKRVHVSAVHGSSVYDPFAGYLSRITQDPATGFAELHCVDLLGIAQRRETPVPMSTDRNLRDFRGVILDGMGVDPADRSMGTGTGEGAMPYTGADREPASTWLDEINRASGSIHFVRGNPTSQQYVAYDRTQLQSAAVAETWSDADFTQPFAETLGGLDYSQEGLINRMMVGADPRPVTIEAEELWRSPESYALPLSGSRVVWAEWSQPALGVTATYTATPGVSVTVQPFRSAARITIEAGVSIDPTVSDLVLSGYPLTTDDFGVEPVAEEEDTASQATYSGVVPGETSSVLIPSLAHAHGLASWYIYRYRDVRARPPVTMLNRLPSQLERDIGDRVAIVSSELSMADAEFWIRSLETVISDSGSKWTTHYNLEAAPELVDIFTVGGTAAQGIGGTAILGY